MVDLLGCVTLCRCELAIPDQGSRVIPFGAPISSRTGSSRLRRGPLTCEAHDGAVLRCGNPVLVPLDPLPLRHHVDRSALLLQLRTGKKPTSILCQLCPTTMPRWSRTSTPRR